MKPKNPKTKKSVKVFCPSCHSVLNRHLSRHWKTDLRRCVKCNTMFKASKHKHIKPLKPVWKPVK